MIQREVASISYSLWPSYTHFFRICAGHQIANIVEGVLVRIGKCSSPGVGEFGYYLIVTTPCVLHKEAARSGGTCGRDLIARTVVN